MSIVSDVCANKRCNDITLRCNLCLSNVHDVHGIAAVINRGKCAMHTASLLLHAMATMRKAITDKHCGNIHPDKGHDNTLFS